jgi:hypothetical protein
LLRVRRCSITKASAITLSTVSMWFTPSVMLDRLSGGLIDIAVQILMRLWIQDLRFWDITY